MMKIEIGLGDVLYYPRQSRIVVVTKMDDAKIICSYAVENHPHDIECVLEELYSLEWLMRTTSAFQPLSQEEVVLSTE